MSHPDLEYSGNACTVSLPPSHATNVIVRIPVPKATVSASHEPLGPGQTSELKLPEKNYLWKTKKIHGEEELILLLKVLTLETGDRG